MDKAKEKLLHKTYDRFVQTSLNLLPLEGIDKFVDTNIMGYGTTIDEKILSVSGYLELVDKQKEQGKDIEMKFDFTPVLRRILADENSAVFVDELNISMLTNNKTFNLFLRFTMVLEYRENKWLVVHWHGSKPEYEEGEADTWHIDEWKEKEERLERLVEEKTEELGRKNRELEIEAALERVRARTMAMHNSDELVEASDVMFDQLKKLKIETLRIGICTIDGKTGAAEIWSRSEIKGKVENRILGVVPAGVHPIFDNMVKAWKENKPFFTSNREGDEVREYYEKLASCLSYPEPNKYNERESVSAFFFEEGSLNVVSLEPLNDEECQIMVRFGRVFGQMYQRFQELRFAEAQTREAKIEAALERVRAKAMAMHNSEDLALTVNTFFSELTDLKVTPHRCGVGIINKKSRSVDIKANTITQSKKVKKVAGILKLSGHPVLSSIFENWKLQKEYHPVLRGNEIVDYYKVMNPQITFPDFAGDEIQYGHYFFFKEGGVFTWTDRDLTENDLNIFRRFTSVLSLTYRRYIDLKNAEAQNILIQAENERKTAELEEARLLQLSMLPKELPLLAHLDIAVYMKTATEVGGDYYDFSNSDNGSLNVCLGDATGHGMKAGIMVSSMKSIFTTNAPKMTIENFFVTANNGVKSMNLKRMMMGFSMLNINKNTFKLINAGMPPVFIFRNKSKTVQEIKEHGMPIGAMNNFKYNVTQGLLEKGDVLLMMSDGMPELHNDKREMYGYERLCDHFKKAGQKEPQEIINSLKRQGSKWVNGADPDDDVTFVLLKLKN